MSTKMILKVYRDGFAEGRKFEYAMTTKWKAGQYIHTMHRAPKGTQDWETVKTFSDAELEALDAMNAE